jgi:hypothetical protein
MPSPTPCQTHARPIARATGPLQTGIRRAVGTTMFGIDWTANITVTKASAGGELVVGL